MRRNTIFVFITIIFTLLVVGLAIWKWGPTGFRGIAWQDSRDCDGVVSFCKDKQVNITYGVYDPAKSFDNHKDITVDHVFYSWRDDVTTQLQPAVLHAQSLDRTLFVAVEPWPLEQSGTETLLQDIVAGKYDAQTKATCQTLNGLKSAPWVSWGHEMDHDLTTRYPWSNRDPQHFISAYKHFVDSCRLELPNAKFVWSPVGDKKLAPYWPGPSYADYVGVPIYSFPEFDNKVYGKDRTFTEAFTDKYNRVKGYNKPVIIAELGVSGEKDYQQYWLDAMKTSYSRFPLLSSVILFNAADTPGAWGADYSTPNWRLKAGVSFP